MSEAATQSTPTNGQIARATAPTMEQALTRAQDSKGSISAFANESSFAAAQRMAKALASSSLVPDAYRGNIPNTLIAMELASRIGCSVFAAMQNLDIIHGRPSWRAQFLIATVNGSGKFSPLRYRWQGKQGTPEWGCRAYAKDDSDNECVGALITMALAKAEGWIEKKGSKWRTMPEQMLMYRAATFWARIYCPELSLGMQTAEEIIDTVGTPVQGNVQQLDTLSPGSPQALEAELLGEDDAPESDPDPTNEPEREPGED